jgi:hypothetical protein
MLVNVKKLDFKPGMPSYAPPVVLAQANISQVVRVSPVDSRRSRRTESCVLVEFLDGETWYCLGAPDAWYEVTV